MKSKHNCPICDKPLDIQDGGRMTKSGVTVFCSNLDCPCQEVFAYESNEAKAFELIKHKYKK